MDRSVFDAAIQDDAALRLSVLAAAAGDARTAEGLAQARAYHVSAARDEVPRGWQVTPDLLAACPRLLCVSSGGAGYDTIDVAACTQAGVAVVNQAGANAASVAEMTYALLLSLVKRLDESGAALRAGTARSREALMGREIEGRAIGLVGIGEIGRRVARIAQGFGLTVIACDPLLTAEEIRARGAEPVDFDTLLARADILSLHCPLDEATRGLMDAWAFARMKPGALFLSTARRHPRRRRAAGRAGQRPSGGRGAGRGASSRPRRRRGCCSIPTWPAPSIPAASRMKAAARWRRAPRARSRRCWPASGPSAPAQSLRLAPVPGTVGASARGLTD